MFGFVLLGQTIKLISLSYAAQAAENHGDE